MALNYSEKRALQKIVIQQLDTLDNVNLDYRAKRAAQKILIDALDKLDESITTIAASLFDQLLSGKFNGLSMNDFISKLQAAYDEEPSLDKAKQSSVGYLEANRAELEAA